MFSDVGKCLQLADADLPTRFTATLMGPVCRMESANRCGQEMVCLLEILYKSFLNEINIIFKGHHLNRLSASLNDRAPHNNWTKTHHSTMHIPACKSVEKIYSWGYDNFNVSLFNNNLHFNKLIKAHFSTNPIIQPKIQALNLIFNHHIACNFHHVHSIPSIREPMTVRQVGHWLLFTIECLTKSLCLNERKIVIFFFVSQFTLYFSLS